MGSNQIYFMLKKFFISFLYVCWFTHERETFHTHFDRKEGKKHDENTISLKKNKSQHTNATNWFMKTHDMELNSITFVYNDD